MGIYIGISYTMGTRGISEQNAHVPRAQPVAYGILFRYTHLYLYLITMVQTFYIENQIAIEYL